MTVNIPELQRIPAYAGQTFSGNVRINRVAQDALRAAFSELDQRQLLPAVRNWWWRLLPSSLDAWKATSLSSHALGIAFDINCDSLRNSPAGPDMQAVAEVMLRHGFVWGGWARSFPEPGHFQYAGPPPASAAS